MWNKIFNFFLFLTLFGLLSCKSKPEELIQKKYAHEIVNEYLQDVGEKHNFFCEGVKWGMHEGILRLIGPRFTMKERLTIPKARELIIELSQDLIHRINESEKIRPYLINYPFTIQNIEMAISDVGEMALQNEEIEFSFLRKSIIYYEKIDKETKRYETAMKESHRCSH